MCVTPRTFTWTVSILDHLYFHTCLHSDDLYKDTKWRGGRDGTSKSNDDMYMTLYVTLDDTIFLPTSYRRAGQAIFCFMFCFMLPEL